MDNKIQELTEKIYLEGVEKGNEEANRIIGNARAQEKVILNDAKIKAGHIITNATKKAEELYKNTEAELYLYGNQVVNALKSEITNLITGTICTSSVKAAMIDKKFTKKIILTLVKSFGKGEQFIIQTSDTDELQAELEAHAKDILDKQVKIEQVNGKKTDFILMPVDGSYKVCFGEEEFINYFKELLRPQLIGILFKEDKP